MATPDQIREGSDYRATIAWSGAEDKPFPRALLVAPSQRARIDDRTFWTYAVIDREEYGRLLDALEAEGLRLAEGTYSGEARGYYVEVENGAPGASAAHVHLGFSDETVRTLERMNAALREEHRAPIQKILDRLSTALPR